MRARCEPGTAGRGWAVRGGGTRRAPKEVLDDLDVVARGREVQRRHAPLVAPINHLPSLGPRQAERHPTSRRRSLNPKGRHSRRNVSLRFPGTHENFNGLGNAKAGVSNFVPSGRAPQQTSTPLRFSLLSSRITRRLPHDARSHNHRPNVGRPKPLSYQNRGHM